MARDRRYEDARTYQAIKRGQTGAAAPSRT